MTGIICGLGACVPARTMDNHEIATLVETSDEWIRERTGVARRHIAVQETTVTMAVDAAKQALEDAKVSPEEVDLILVSSVSSNVVLPCTACEVQRAIGAKGAACFDLNAACTGFLFAYETACAYLESGRCKTALIIGSETLSNLLDWSDRGTCILFGDGAGAAVVRAGAGVSYKSVLHSDGNRGEALTMKSRYGSEWREIPDQGAYMQMDGQAVFKFAVKQVPEAVREVLDMNQMTLEEIDCFILHQANSRIVEAVAKRLRAPVEKFPMNLQEYGNTSSASIPILLTQLHRRGVLKKGQRLLIAGFGAGLSWGAAIMDWEH